MLRRAHLTGPALELLRRRIVISVFLCWVPLAVLSLVQAHFLGGAKLSFFRDIETHIRFLVSLPVLILAEMIVHQRIRPVVKSFVERRVVTPEELPKFYAAIDSARRVRNSVIVEIALLVFVFTVGMSIWRHQGALEVASWYASPQGGQMHLTTGRILVCVCQHAGLPVHPAALVYADPDLVLVSAPRFASQTSLTARTSGPGRWTWILG